MLMRKFDQSETLLLGALLDSNTMEGKRCQKIQFLFHFSHNGHICQKNIFTPILKIFYQRVFIPYYTVGYHCQNLEK